MAFQPLTPFHDLLAELRRRQLAVLQQQNRVDRFLLHTLSTAKFSNGAPVEKPKRVKNRMVPGFVIEALNALPQN